MAEVHVPVTLPADWKEKGDRRNPSSPMKLADALGKAVIVRREGQTAEATVVILGVGELSDDIRDRLSRMVKIRDLKGPDAKA